MINPGGSYLSRQTGRGNHPTHKCVIEIGNLALPSQGASATASSQFSADWPAAGAIDGDLTHINAGAPAVADDGVGGSVWQSATVADGGGNFDPPEWLKIDLGQVRKINRIKIIFWPATTLSNNLGSIGADTFAIYRGDGTSPGDGFGEGGFGDGGYGGAASGDTSLVPWDTLADKCAEIGKAPTGISGGVVTGNTNDMVVYEDPNPQQVRYVEIDIAKLQSGGVGARIVAVEITLATDVTKYVKAARRTRQKDYHLQRRTAAELDITLLNFDKRFNDKHVPTAAERADGFFSDFIRPHLPVRYFAGFSGIHVPMIAGTIETWNPDSKRRTVDIVCFDFLKSIVTPTITVNLKQNQLIEALIEYTCNRQNFPSNMMILDSTTVKVGFFFPQGQKIQDVLNNLQDATGDAEVYIDEYGRLIYRNYLTTVSHQFDIQAQGGWAIGAYTNIDDQTLPGSVRRKWFLMSDFNSGTVLANPTWTITPGSPNITVSGGIASNTSNVDTTQMYLATAAGFGSWQFKWQGQTGAIGQGVALAIQDLVPGGGNPSGYLWSVNGDGQSNNITVERLNASGTNTIIHQHSATIHNGDTIRITFSAAGKSHLYINGVEVTQVAFTDTNYNSFSYLVIDLSNSIHAGFSDLYWSEMIDATSAVTNTQASWISPVFDQGATVSDEGILEWFDNEPATTSVTYYTRTSPDSITWGAWTQVASSGDAVGSALERYAQIKAVLNCPIDAPYFNISEANLATPTISDITWTYHASAGSARTGVSADWTAADYGLLLGDSRVLSSIAGGNNFIFTQAVVKAKPLIPSLASQTAWQGTVGGKAVSAANPLFLPVGDTVIAVDFGNTSFSLPQTVNIALGTAVATTSLTSHPTNPVLTITVTTAGSITGLTISGYPFLTTTTVQATAFASQFVRENYDENVDELDNDYIDNVVLAQDIANERMTRFGQGALDWIKQAEIRFFPGAQINDRVTAVDSHAEINADYYLLASTDEISQDNSKQFTAKTSIELVKLT